MVVRLNIIEFPDTVQMPKMKWSNAIAVKRYKKNLILPLTRIILDS